MAYQYAAVFLFSHSAALLEMETVPRGTEKPAGGINFARLNIIFKGWTGVVAVAQQLCFSISVILSKY